MGNGKGSELDKCELYDTKPEPKRVGLPDFKIDHVIGKGGFGKVK